MKLIIYVCRTEMSIISWISCVVWVNICKLRYNRTVRRTIAYRCTETLREINKMPKSRRSQKTIQHGPERASLVIKKARLDGLKLKVLNVNMNANWVFESSVVWKWNYEYD